MPSTPPTSVTAEPSATSWPTRRKIASVNLEYNQEVLASVTDLREHDVATRPDVLLAEMDVEMAEIRLKQLTQRAKACRE